MNLLLMAAILLTFVGIDKWLVPRAIAATISSSGDYRSRLSYGELKAFVDNINTDETPKIIMIGDSITQGGGVANGDETIAHYLEQNVRKQGSLFHVYNLGLQGAQTGDSYFILKSIHLTNRDLVLYDLNSSDYGTGTGVKFPTITAALSANVAKANATKSVHDLDSTSVEARLRLFVTNHWKLFGSRNLIKDYIKGIKGKTSAKKVAAEPRNPDPLPWYTTNWTSRTKGAFKRGANTFTNNDANLTYLKSMIRCANSEGARILVYNIALNQQMMRQYDMMNRNQYNQNISKLKAIVLKGGAKFEDYETLVPSRDFVDSLHPTEEGNRILANRLAVDLSSGFTGKSAQ